MGIHEILILASSVLYDWLDVVKPGGIIGFTHKTSVWPAWEPTQEKISAEHRWTTLFIHPGIPYLPSLKVGETNCQELVRIYFYRKNT